MRTRVLRVAVALLIILSLVTASTAYAFGSVVYSNTRWLADNLEYINTITWDAATSSRTESFAIRMTGPGDAYPIVLSGETVFGANRISTMVSYAESLGKNVLAVANADFFFSQGAVPIGIAIENGIYKSSAQGRNAVVFGKDGSVDIVPAPSVWISLFNDGGAPDVDNAGKVVGLSNFNIPRADAGGLILYSDAYSTVSTRTTTPGWYVRFRVLEGEMTVSGSMLLEVIETLTSSDSVPIGEGNMVLTASEASGVVEEFEKFAVGDIVRLATSTTDERVANAAFATGGGDILVSNGHVTDAATWDQSIASRAPRTAFGIRADGSVVSYVVDGRRSEHSVGLSLVELAEEMRRQGSIFAVNLDGGGSSALSVRIPGESRSAVVNRPSDGSERGCATYILFVTDAVPGGGARNLGLRNNGVVVMTESSVDLSFVATDRGYMPAGVPRDIQVTPLERGASVSGATYTAGSIAGIERLSLFSPSTNASGTGEVFVIARPTSITARRKNTTMALNSVRLSPGQTLEFDVAATYYRRPVVAQAHSFTYTISGDIGEMVAPGVFRAADTIGSAGTIAISAGGTSTTISVEVGVFTDMLTHWAREYAEFLGREGITIGVTPTEYGPELLMRRCDYVLMLYRAAGEPAVNTMTSFDDVPTDAYYSRALSWAKEAGVVHSLRDNDFEPLSPISRQDAFTFTYRALGILGIQYTDGTSADLERFPDSGSVEAYAVTPTATLIRLGVVEGSGGLLIPQETLTRAQMAKVIAVVLQLPTQQDAQQQVPPQMPPDAPPEIPPDAPPEVPPEAPPQVPPDAAQDLSPQVPPDAARWGPPEDDYNVR